MNKIKKDNCHRNDLKRSRLLTILKIFSKMSKKRKMEFKLFGEEIKLEPKKDFVVVLGKKVSRKNPEKLCNS